MTSVAAACVLALPALAKPVLRQALRQHLLPAVGATPSSDEPPAASTPAARATVPMPDAGHRPRVLVVEDDALNRRIVCRLLQHEGCEVVPAADIAKLVARLSQQKGITVDAARLAKADELICRHTQQAQFDLRFVVHVVLAQCCFQLAVAIFNVLVQVPVFNPTSIVCNPFFGVRKYDPTVLLYGVDTRDITVPPEVAAHELVDFYLIPQKVVFLQSSK